MSDLPDEIGELNKDEVSAMSRDEVESKMWEYKRRAGDLRHRCVESQDIIDKYYYLVGMIIGKDCASIAKMKDFIFHGQ